MIRATLLILLILAAAPLAAQETLCPDSTYQRLIREGKQYEKTDFQKALKRYNAARICRPDKAGEVDGLILGMFRTIEGQREEAIKQAENAKRSEAKARKLQQEAEATLKKFEAASAQIVLFLMIDADNLIKALNYEGALEKVKAAIPLQQEAEAVEKRLLEIAYVYNETGRYERVAGLLDTLYNQVRKTSRPFANASSLEDLRRALRIVAPLWYDTLHTMRYYPEMVWVEGGAFTMGCDTDRGDRDCEDDELPPHTVTLSDFRIARTETTVWQFYIYCENDSINIRDFAPGWGLSGDNPIVNVNWYQATQYANWLSNRLPGFEPAYRFDEEGNFLDIDSAAGPAFRLPTEAQWEYAARGGKKDIPSLFAGSDNLDEVGWYGENSEIDGVEQTHPVGAKKANELGLFDMSGNVWEWCQDWKGPYEESAEPNPKGPPTGDYRVLRGGSWYVDYRSSRVSLRINFDPWSGYDFIGFRLSQDSK